jgi:hypothetical protein
VDLYTHSPHTSSQLLYLIFFLFCGGVRLGPLGKRAINWPIVPVPDDDDDDCGAVSGMTMARETEVLGGNLPQCHFVYHKFHMS